MPNQSIYKAWFESCTLYARDVALLDAVELLCQGPHNRLRRLFVSNIIWDDQLEKKTA